MDGSVQQSNQLDQDRLDGRLGKAMPFAMETIVTAAHIDQVDTLTDIGFAHIDACFYNSVIGARTNKYGDCLDVRAAMTGRALYSNRIG